MLKNLKKKKNNNNKGFTLVELLVVIAIIGILAVVAVPSLMRNIDRAKATDIISYLSAAKTAAISEFAATQPDADMTILMADLDKLVEDKPKEITAATVTVELDGNVKMEVTVGTSQKLANEVNKQAISSFGAGKVTVTTTQNAE